MEGVMGTSQRNRAAIVAVMTLLTCLGLLWKQSAAQSHHESSTAQMSRSFTRLPFPANASSKFERSVNSSRDDTNCRRLWSGWSLA